MTREREQIVARIFELLDIIHNEETTGQQFDYASDLIVINLNLFIRTCKDRLAPAFNKLQHAGLGEIFEMYYPTY